jgi:methionyl-tRNA formyltransferase
MVEINNKIRGLSPFPGAWSYLNIHGKAEICKIYKSRITTEFLPGLKEPGEIFIQGKKQLFVATLDGLIEILELQPSGKRRFTALEFINGLKNGSEIRFQNPL